MAYEAESTDIIRNFNTIEIKKPADEIIAQIRKLISEGILAPGDKLPSERDMAARLGVGRGHLREAIKKLEFYGILKTLPQSGTVVASLGVKALEGLIANILDLDKEDYRALMETRVILEINAARLAAERATGQDIAELQQSYQEMTLLAEQGQSNMEEDHLFHLKVAECSKNAVLRSLIGLITPDVITMSSEQNTCRDGRNHNALAEHGKVLAAIVERNPDKAEAAMAYHMEMSRKQFDTR